MTSTKHLFAPEGIGGIPVPDRLDFLANLDAVRAQGFDERFVRMWEYYLALCEAGFAVGLTQDHQIVMEKARGLDA